MEILTLEWNESSRSWLCLSFLALSYLQPAVGYFFPLHIFSSTPTQPQSLKYKSFYTSDFIWQARLLIQAFSFFFFFVKMDHLSVIFLSLNPYAMTEKDEETLFSHYLFKVKHLPLSL